MYMTESEILAEWKGAKDRRKQITILADENCCTPDEIIATLKAAGVDGRAIRPPAGVKKKKEGGGPSTAPTETSAAAPPEAPSADILLSMIASLTRENEKLWALVMTMASNK